MLVKITPESRKRSADLGGLGQNAAWIVAKIENQTFNRRFLCFERVQGRHKIIIGVFSELCDPYVAVALLQQDAFDAVDGNQVSDKVELQRFCFAFPQDGQ